MTTRIRRALARRARGDAGFTLIEVIIAMVITVTVMTALVYGVVGSLKTIQQAKQRQTATALASQTLERLRAMPYDSVTLPNGSSYAAGLPYASSTNGISYFDPPASLLPGGLHETLIVNGVSGQWATQLVDQVTYKVSTYVTLAPVTQSGSQSYNLTVIVDWASSVWPGGREVAQRSTTFSPAGCLSTATSPFAAPCQAYVTARAGEALSGITASDPTDSTLPLLGTDALGSAVDQLLLNFSSTSATFIVEQTASGTATATTSSAQSKGATSTSTGGESAKATVDSDPSSTPNQSVTDSTTQSADTISIGTNGTPGDGTLSVTPTAGDVGDARAAVAADGTICIGAGGTALTTGSPLRPCASSDLKEGGGGALTYVSPLKSANVALATFSGESQPSRAIAAVLGVANTNACDGGGTPVDCVHAAASRSLNTFAFAATPAMGTVPFDTTKGLWNVSGLQETARAEEGVGATSDLSKLYTRAGTLWVYTGSGPYSGYEQVDLSQFETPASALLPASQQWDIPTTSVQYSSAISITYSGSVIVQRPKVVRTPVTRTGDPTVDCQSAACTTSVNGSGAVVGRVDVSVYLNGSATPFTRFAVVTDLGGLTADVSYKAAPNAP